MDYQALFQWTSIIGGLASLFVLFYLLPLNRKKLKSEIRLNNADADKSIYDSLKMELERLKEDYQKMQERVKKLEETNGTLQKINSLFRIAAENLGFWELIEKEIERIKG